MYSPLVSVHSSPAADAFLQSVVNAADTSVLSILKPYGNNVQYPIPNQSFKITNNQLITKNYPSFPVRFDFPLQDLLSIASSSSSDHSSSLQQLFSISSLERLLKELPFDANDDLYLAFFNKVITSNSIVAFHTFNHPISQIFVIDYANDSVDYLRARIVEFRNYRFPPFFQINDLLVHAFVVYDENAVGASELAAFEADVNNKLSVAVTFIPVVFQEPEKSASQVEILVNQNSTIDEDLQRISFGSTPDHFMIPTSVDRSLRGSIHQFISQQLIPHMEKKVRLWDDQILAPKRSITNRFFSASRKLFNNNNASDHQADTSSFNYQENYYHKSSPEQSIRKLADWSLILKDFKYSYSVYDLIKKDYNNDKAWIYVASTQEMCIISLLLVQTQLANNLGVSPDRNTLRRIRNDIIEPYLDNLSYTYKSRLNLKTYNLRTLLVVVELLQCMCSTFKMYWWWIDLIEKYLVKCVQEFDAHLIASNQSSQVIKAIIYERLGFVFGKISVESMVQIDHQEQEKPPEEEGLYHNPYKIRPKRVPYIVGSGRFRKSSTWYLLSIKEWLALEKYDHIKVLLSNIRYSFDLELTDNWYNRSDLLLGIIKRRLVDQDKVPPLEVASS
ncbi:hypothetical protein PSN45_003592 [Yamadazyma tenuis]|nr:hypothetical protein PSN45_003592 [Yamadazyma tenuis]